MKLSEAFLDYELNEILAMNYSTNTLKVYQNTARVAIKYFGDVSIKKLSIEDVHSFYLFLTGKVSKNTARRYISNFRCVIKYCRKKGLRVMNPDEIRTPRGEKKVARFLSEEQVIRFLSVAGTPSRGYSKLNMMRNMVVIQMLYESGLRVSELCSLDRGSIKNREFVVVGKSKEPRPCYITKALESELNDYLSARTDDNPALFISVQNGERLTPHNVQEIFRRLSKQAGVGIVTPHTLRHSYATKFLDSGVDIRLIAKLLGHQSINTTQQYAHVTDRLLRDVYQSTMGENCGKLSAKSCQKHIAI